MEVISSVNLDSFVNSFSLDNNLDCNFNFIDWITVSLGNADLGIATD